MEEVFKRKLEKYQVLGEKCCSNQWRSTCLLIEVVNRSFVGRSLCRILSRLAVRGSKWRKALTTTSESAEKASNWLLIKRLDPWSSAGVGVLF